MRKLLLLVVLISGCSTIQQALHGYGSAAVTSIKAAEDDNIALWTINACGTPLSAAIRNPQVIPALRVLCIPGGAGSSPSLLLESVPKSGQLPLTQ